MNFITKLVNEVMCSSQEFSRALQETCKIMEEEKMINITNNAVDKVKVTVNEKDGNAQVIIDLIRDKVELSVLKPGETFKADDGTEYIVLEQICGNATAVIEKELLSDTMKFDSLDNNWKHSKIREFLNGEHLRKVADRFGKDNILAHTVDLLSLDGLKDYDSTTDSVSLLTIDQYRKYREVLGNNMDKS